MSNRSDMLDLVVRNEAVFIHPAIQCRHDLRVIKGDVVEKRLRLDSIKHEVPVVAIRLPELTVAERLFWQYLIVQFCQKIVEAERTIYYPAAERQHSCVACAKNGKAAPPLGGGAALS